MNAPQTRAESTALTAYEAPRILGGRDLILQPDNLNALIRVSELMANSGQAVPRHLRKNPGACFAVTSQAMRWNMDPFALAQKTYTTDDNAPLAYEGQAIIAALNNSPLLSTRLFFEWGGAWDKIIGRFVWKDSTKKTDENTGKPKKYLAKAWDDNDEQGLWCTVTATLVGEKEPRVLQLFLMQARVRNSPLWVEDPRQQLAYLASRRWGRLYAPDVIMGVYTPDELAEISPEKFMGLVDEVAPPAAPAPAPDTYPQEKFDTNFAQWEGIVQSKRKTHPAMIAFIEAKGVKLTEEQKARINSIKVPAAQAEDAKPAAGADADGVFTPPTFAEVADKLTKAKTRDELNVAGDLIKHVADASLHAELQAKFDAREAELTQ